MGKHHSEAARTCSLVITEVKVKEERPAKRLPQAFTTKMSVPQTLPVAFLNTPPVTTLPDELLAASTHSRRSAHLRDLHYFYIPSLNNK